MTLFSWVMCIRKITQSMYAFAACKQKTSYQRTLRELNCVIIHQHNSPQVRHNSPCTSTSDRRPTCILMLSSQSIISISYVQNKRQCTRVFNSFVVTGAEISMDKMYDIFIPALARVLVIFLLTAHVLGE